MNEEDYLSRRYEREADFARREQEYWDAKARGYYVGDNGWKVDVHPGARPPSEPRQRLAENGRHAHQLDMMAGIKYC